MKIPLKFLGTIALCGIAWFLTWVSMLALNMPNTLMVVVGLCGVTLTVCLWIAGMNWMWGLRGKFSTLYGEIKKEIT